MNSNHNKFKIVLAAVFILGLLFESGEASASLIPSNSDISNSENEFFVFEQYAASTGTLFINLPIIEQNAPTSTSTPLGGYPGPIQATPSETFTPTPTPLPIQTGSTNVPIVLGVIGIIFVILIAWLFFGFLPQRSKG